MTIKQVSPKEAELAQKAFQTLLRAMGAFPEIEGNIWFSVMHSIQAQSYVDSGHSYEDYYHDIYEMLTHYKKWWDDG